MNLTPDLVTEVGPPREVTEEQSVTEAIAADRLLGELIQSADQFVQVLDKDFRFLAINEANINEYDRAYGFRPKVGDSLIDLLADRPELREPVLAVWSRALAGETFTVVQEFGDASLQRRYYDIRFQPLLDAAGVIIGAYHFSDIAERRAEVPHRECAFETLQAIRLKVVEASPDAKIVVNKQRYIIDLNEEAEYLFGYARADLLGKRIDVLIPKETGEQHASHMEKFFRSPRRREMGAVGMQLTAVNRDGEHFKVKIRLAPIVIGGPEGGVYGLAVVRRDDL
jgi:PAS domain S-box-containing protein